jgi:hypothetical protein
MVTAIQPAFFAGAFLDAKTVTAILPGAAAGQLEK